MSEKQVRLLKRGWITGACAAAAARACFMALIEGDFPDPVSITLPGGQTPAFALAYHEFSGEMAIAAVIKDAGDDPDVTHGVPVIVRLKRLRDDCGVLFKAGEGVGIVTRSGLELAIGEPAINLAPRKMISSEIETVAKAHSVSPNVEIEISIPNGERLAKRTLNRRLGIVGGLSVLGTTGVVIPFSCSAWIHSIHRGIDVARAAGVVHLAASTGSTSERAVKNYYSLADEALVDMGDFAGGTLKYIKRFPVPKLSIAGGFAKLSKLGSGFLDLHSRRGSVDLDWLAGLVAESGGPVELVAKVKKAQTAGQVLQLANLMAFPIGDLVARAARTTALLQLSETTNVEVLIFNRRGELVGHNDG